MAEVKWGWWGDMEKEREMGGRESENAYKKHTFI